MLKNIKCYASRSRFAITCLLLLTPLLLPLLGGQPASAAQLTTRFITLASSKAAKTDVTYDTRFTIATTGNVGGMVVDFCSNSPLTGSACTTPTGFDVNEAGLALANQTGITGWTVDAATDPNTIILARTASSITSGTAARVDFGAGGASDGVTNPSTACGGAPADKCTYYARIFTFATTAAAQGYTSTVPGAYVDDGAVAVSTANQITVSARVQEVLQFCVGTINGAAPSDCSGMSTTTSVDLGVLDSGTVSISPVAAGSGGNNLNGAAMIRTNATGGVVIDYLAEQAITGTNHLGTLRVAGATCNAGTVSTDQCVNAAGTTQSAFAAGTEEYGMTISSIDVTSGTTTNLVRDTQYDGDGTAAQGFAWDETGVFDRIASSAGGAQPENRVVDDEMLLLRFAAAIAATTPTGSYTVVSTYVATATF